MGDRDLCKRQRRLIPVVFEVGDIFIPKEAPVTMIGSMADLCQTTRNINVASASNSCRSEGLASVSSPKQLDL